MRALKYILAVLLFAGGFRSFTHTGIIVWIPLLVSFGLIPVLELTFKPDTHNLSDAEEGTAQKQPLYDWLLYAIIPLQYIGLFLFLRSMQDPTLNTWDIIGRICVMGLMCGIFGINVGHELGHREKKYERLLAKSLLLTSLYMHFSIDHNKGHHKEVGTPADPTTARFGEPLYLFWVRSIIGAYKRAWRIANTETIKKGKGFLHNEMLHYQLIQLTFCLLIGFLFGEVVLFYFLCAAMGGILLLETVNYIEHYGLTRKLTEFDGYERAKPEHSWNSNHPVGRLMLFELSRHSDHHYLASRKYQVLRHHDDSPQLPTGYPGSMLLAMIPPLWFKIMNEKIRARNLANAK